MEKISVIVPIYNVEKYLERCIESIINQTYKNLEIILIDDGSIDSSPEICDKYAKKDDRITVIHKKNGGLSDARNRGLDIASGEYITLIDSDDFIDSDYVEFLYRLIKKQNGIEMSICSRRAIYNNGTILDRDFEEFAIVKPKEVLEKMLYDENIEVSAWAKLYDKKIFKDVRYPKGRLFEDAATTYKLIIKCNKISIGLKSKYNYMIREDSITNKVFSLRKMDLIDSTEEMCLEIKEVYPELEKACQRRMIYAYLSTLSQLAKSDKKYPKEQKKMMTYVKKNGKKILINKRVPKRDKMAIISLFFGFGFYKLSWKIYEKITGRK